jgi:hypothetical protein
MKRYSKKMDEINPELNAVVINLSEQAVDQAKVVTNFKKAGGSGRIPALMLVKQ